MVAQVRQMGLPLPGCRFLELQIVVNERLSCHGFEWHLVEI